MRHHNAPATDHPPLCRLPWLQAACLAQFSRVCASFPFPNAPSCARNSQTNTPSTFTLHSRPLACAYLYPLAWTCPDHPLALLNLCFVLHTRLRPCHPALSSQPSFTQPELPAGRFPASSSFFLPTTTSHRAPYMSTAQSTASPRPSRGKQHHPQNAAHVQAQGGKHTQRKPRGNRAHNAHSQHDGSNASPSRPPTQTDHAFTEPTDSYSEDAQFPNGSRKTKKHNQSHASMTDTEAVPIPPSATPVKIQGAYAGPTFHASPAPSALPIPKFLSRSVPAKTRTGPPTPPPEDSSDSANSPSPPIASPSRAPIAHSARHQDSPLDLLFNADKAERAKNIHGSPPSAGFASPANAIRPPHFKHDSFTSLNGVFPIELDSQSNPSQISSPPATAGTSSRSVTDPGNIPQRKDASPSTNGNEVMQDLFHRLTMSQKNVSATTPPKVNGHVPSEPQSRHQTPSPFHDGRTAVRSASGPSTPAPLNQESPEYFYGNRNLSPLFQAAKGDPWKRNSGLRTEITADSPLVSQGMFQDFPSVPPPRMADPGAYANNYPGGNEGPNGPRRGSVPIIQPYQQSPNNRRRTPGRQGYQPRPDSYPARVNPNAPPPKAGRGAGNGISVPAKPSTTMMSFVPASVAAKRHSTSTPPTIGTPPPIASPPSDTLALEQDLKRLLNLKTTEDTAGN